MKALVRKLLSMEWMVVGGRGLRMTTIARSRWSSVRRMLQTPVLQGPLPWLRPPPPEKPLLSFIYVSAKTLYQLLDSDECRFEPASRTCHLNSPRTSAGYQAIANKSQADLHPT